MTDMPGDKHPPFLGAPGDGFPRYKCDQLCLRAICGSPRETPVISRRATLCFLGF